MRSGYISSAQPRNVPLRHWEGALHALVWTGKVLGSMNRARCETRRHVLRLLKPEYVPKPSCTGLQSPGELHREPDTLAAWGELAGWSQGWEGDSLLPLCTI